MRAYRKGTRHPVCIYLNDEEAAELVEELADAVPYCPEELPILAKIRDVLPRVMPGG